MVVLEIGVIYEELLFQILLICNITQESQELQRFSSACGFIGKSAVIEYHQLLSKVTYGKLLFDQLATASSSILLYLKWI